MDEDSYAACVGGWATIWSSATFAMLQHVAWGTTSVESAVSERERECALSFETVQGLRRMRVVPCSVSDLPEGERRGGNTGIRVVFSVFSAVQEGNIWNVTVAHFSDYE